MSKEILHSLLIIIVVALGIIFARTPLAQYDLQIFAFLFIVLYVSKRFVIPQKPHSQLMESVIMTFVIVSLVTITGLTTSPFFFLLYFLLFAIGLLLEPMVSIGLTISLVVLLMLSLPQGQDLKALLPIFSLAFLTPFAIFMAQEFRENEKLKTKSEKLEKDSFLFLSLVVKNHVSAIKNAAENFTGDKELEDIKKQTRRLEKLIEEFEK